MPIATTTAIIGAAAIGAGATLAASSSSNSAINNATQAQQQSNANSLALQGQIYQNNVALQAPNLAAGNKATEGLNALLYGPNPTAELQSSPGYQFRFNEGMRALNNTLAGRRLGDSGAAVKAAQQYGQNFGSNEYSNRYNMLAGQQGVGLSAANALAGVGTNYANTVTNINQANADAMGNAAIAKANNNNALFGNIAGITGNALGSLSSYGGGRNPYGIMGGGIY